MRYNIDSDNINVFPSVQRDSTFYESRQLTESRLTGLIRNITPSGTYLDDDNIEIPLAGFVITDDDYISSGVFEFNIGGYYFKVSTIEQILNKFSSANRIWAGLNFGEEGWIKPDENDAYIGVSFYDSTSEITDATYTLLLLQKDAGRWTIPLESRICSGFPNIDGGDVSEQ